MAAPQAPPASSSMIACERRATESSNSRRPHREATNIASTTSIGAPSTAFAARRPRRPAALP
eukprot:12827333-Alexandrium_andersonii.AAC.1